MRELGAGTTYFYSQASTLTTVPHSIFICSAHFKCGSSLGETSHFVEIMQRLRICSEASGATGTRATFAFEPVMGPCFASDLSAMPHVNDRYTMFLFPLFLEWK